MQSSPALSRHPFLPWLATVCLTCLLALPPACGASISPYDSSGGSSSDDAGALAWGFDAADSDGDEEAQGDETVSSSLDAGALVVPEGGASPPFDAAFDGGAPCTQELGAGSLSIDELMIESVAGTGDDGEWLEVASMAACTMNLRGLHGDCPVGAKVHTFDVTEDVWLPAGGRFLIADSADPAVNHDLPGVVFTWSGQPGDVLRNLGGTVTLSTEDAMVVSLTWPALKITVGVSVELPAGCAVDDAGFAEWQAAQWSWFPSFYGTPNQPNTDVECP